MTVTRRLISGVALSVCAAIVALPASASTQVPAPRRGADCAACTVIAGAFARAAAAAEAAVVAAEQQAALSTSPPSTPCPTACAPDLSTAAGAVQFALDITRRVTSMLPPSPCNAACIAPRAVPVFPRGFPFAP